MVCPICAGSSLSDDFSVIHENGDRVILQGVVRKIYSPGVSNVPPCNDYFTVTLQPKKGGVKYLKFKTQEELNNWGFIEGKRARCRGCLHIIDEKDLVFDVTEVNFL